MAYIEQMRRIAENAYNEVYQGVRELVFTDFPDYPNVGDSAIALGQLRYFATASISVKSAYCIATLQSSVFESKIPVMINGGGNIAGLFDGIDDHRNSIAQRLNSDTLLIQAPQSIHFATDRGRSRFIREFSSRQALRMCVRDATAVEDLTGIIAHPILAPDAVHHLGQIASPPPIQSRLVLARKDQESNANDIPAEAQDWKKDTFRPAISSFIRWKSMRLPPAGRFLNKSISGWERIAQQRLDRGIAILSQGETVITDRLHAMLISLQMGRRVIAVDNKNKKLTKYAETWFGHAQPDIRFANSFSDAINLTS
ncbi:polysaccharide pyruvyl transferase family protein [Rhodococcus sp. SJ-3]|uniref:polysaccharide pyruvyl transferase family protein n=1 Tax=Rhodococcus sp. SJ-3 TaxID=3454628 RepID=UPI003F7B1A99